MKLIHTSDWHLGQNFYRYDRDDEHRHFFSQLCKILDNERPDALVVSGDIFHNPAPAASSRRLFVEGVTSMHDASPDTVIIITAGNHDSGSRLDADSRLWQRIGVRIIGSAMRNADGTFDPEHFIVRLPDKGTVVAVPYFHPSNFPMAKEGIERSDRQRLFFERVLEHAADGMPLVMMAHLAVDGCNTLGHEDEPVGGMLKEKLSDLGEGYDYLALGHIHMPQTITPRAYYCGTPIPVSFSEEYSHYVNMVEIANHGDVPKVSKIELDLLRQVRTVPTDGAPLDDALQALIDHPDDDISYVRVLVDQEEILPADAEDRARKIAESKACRYCEIRRKPKKQKKVKLGEIEVMEVEDVTSLDPLTIAQRSFERKHGAPMNETLIEMMKHVITLANENSISDN